MADEGNVITNLDLGSEGNGEDNLPAAGIISQYVKDLSVENPAALRCPPPPNALAIALTS